MLKAIRNKNCSYNGHGSEFIFFKEDDMMGDMCLLGAVILILIYIYLNNKNK